MLFKKYILWPTTILSAVIYTFGSLTFIYYWADMADHGQPLMLALVLGILGSLCIISSFVWNVNNASEIELSHFWRPTIYNALALLATVVIMYLLYQSAPNATITAYLAGNGMIMILLGLLLVND